MTTAQDLQSLLEQMKKITDQCKTAQTSLQQLHSTKKEAEIKKRQQDALNSLQELDGTMSVLQQHMRQTEQELQKALGVTSDKQTKEVEVKEKVNIEQAVSKSKSKGIIEARNLTTEEQEALYELKSSRLKATATQAETLKKEADLQQKKKQMAEERYAQSQSYPGSETLKAVHSLEAKLRGANLKIKGLEEELHRSQQTAVKYRELYESGKHDGHNSSENDGATSTKRSNSPARSKSTPKIKPAPLDQQSFIGPNTNVNDLVRKNECLLEENEQQKREIHRLKQDNAQLLLKAKSAASENHDIMAQLCTSESARTELHNRYDKIKMENEQLRRSYTRQASEWLETKKQIEKNNSQERWKAINPVAPHGGKERWIEHTAKKNSDTPKQMFPVEKYALASA